VIGVTSKYYENESMFHGFIPHIMGTRFDILIIHSNESQMNDIWVSIVDELEQLDKMLNCFNTKSEASYINSRAFQSPVSISDEMNIILHLCQYYYKQTLHLFDITLKKFSNIVWHNKQSISFNATNISLDFGGFAKGYALKKIRDILWQKRIEHAFIDFGNSGIMGIGHHPYGDCWKVNLINPYTKLVLDEFNLRNTSLSTSGNTPQNPKHIINPLTEKYNEHKEASIIVSDNPLDAEVLSTVWMIANAEQRKQISRNFNYMQATIYHL
jgi:thiamine biosynthesis lipoprotein